MSFHRRWKPNATQRKKYAEKMREAEEKFTFISSPYPLREGCYVEYVDKATNEIICGTITKSTYQRDNQHRFTLDCFLNSDMA